MSTAHISAAEAELEAADRATRSGRLTHDAVAATVQIAQVHAALAGVEEARTANMLTAAAQLACFDPAGARLLLQRACDRLGPAAPAEDRALVPVEAAGGEGVSAGACARVSSCVACGSSTCAHALDYRLGCTARR